jgi:hypothetical protein
MKTISITYIDGSIDKFESEKYLFTEKDNEDENNALVLIKENKLESTDEDYDDELDVIVAEIQMSQIRKIQYD